MMKSLRLVLPAALLISVPAWATEPAHQSTTISSDRSVSQGARDEWFRNSVGDILEGRAASPSHRTMRR